MKIDKFVTWPRVLEPNEIREAFIEGRLFTYMPNNKACKNHLYSSIKKIKFITLTP